MQLAVLSKLSTTLVPPPSSNRPAVEWSLVTGQVTYGFARCRVSAPLHFAPRAKIIIFIKFYRSNKLRPSPPRCLISIPCRRDVVASMKTRHLHSSPSPSPFRPHYDFKVLVAKSDLYNPISCVRLLDSESHHLITSLQLRTAHLH